MDFALNDEQEMIRQTARDFAQRELLPQAAARDLSGEFPLKELGALAELGLMGVNVPDAYGGAEAGALAFSVVMQELAKVDASVAVTVSVTNMVAELISAYGTDEQKKRHVSKITSGEAVCGAFALSEPQAGSDPSAMRTSATKIDGGWRIKGDKQWISHGDKAGVMIVWAITDKEAGTRGISAFIVEGGVKGLEVVSAEHKMGLRGSTTVQLGFEDVLVGEDAMLGTEGMGFKLAMAALDGGRIGISSQALGVATAALEASLAYAQEREQFGQPIIRHQAIANKLADMATKLEASKLLIMRAAWMKDRKLPFSKEASMAKVFATEKACEICDEAIQIHGGNGYTQDFPLERFYRDVRVTRIYEGTSEIQRIVIARQLIKEASK
ncbi:MAG: acyl-CoA dehydrogenase [Myxococcales bacterium]|nr:acyl-CoA dehydrogenase [Myxococcales bacterium]